MKILMITPYLPYPLLSGGQIRTYNLLKHLSLKHEITLFSFVRSEKERQYTEELKKFCNSVRIFLKRPPWSITSLFLSAVTIYPLVVCMYLKRKMKSEIEKEVKKQHFDLIHAETFYVMPNIPPNTIPTILVEQTIEYLVYQHYTEIMSFFPLKWLMQYDVYKIRFWEKKFWQRASRVVAMSEADKKEMQKLVPDLTVDLVPNGVDADFFVQRKKKIRTSQIVLFVGNFKWLQNREAVSILIQDVWPKIKRELPKAKLWIMGRYPPNEILKFASDSISVFENVSDIRKGYNEADVLLAPIYGPGGTRYKILESMAAGLPVVTTPTGIEGLGAVDNRDALICCTVSELAQATVKVLTDENLYRCLAINGKRLVEEKFNWKNIATDLERIYEEAAYGQRY